MNVLIVLGSLRKASFSRKLARAVCETAGDSLSFQTIDGRDLPLYDQDIDGEEKPAAVTRILDQISNADAMIFISPEFNYGIPGPLKNLIDWASRPAFRSPLKGKPSLVMTLSPAPSGGTRAHAQLSAVLFGTLTPLFLAPSFLVPAVHEKFDEDGALIDEITKVRLVRTLEEFESWATGLVG